MSKPSDLIPELQGRFPIRVELKSLTKEDFVKILTDDAIEEIARISEEINNRTENIGARRLHTVMEKLLEDISFNASEMAGQYIIIDGKFVRSKLQDVAQDEELSRYIL